MNPLNTFLLKAEPAMRIAYRPANQQRVTEDQYEAFTENAEERNFASDVVERIQQISFCFDRLCELGVEWHDLQQAQKRGQNDQHIDLAKVPIAVLAREERWKRELHITTSFAFYEIKSVCDMLRSWNIDLSTCRELNFLLKSRDRFLAHPRLGGVMRLAHRGCSIPFDGGPVDAPVAGLSMAEPITHAFYKQQLGVDANVAAFDETERSKNEACVLSRTTNERLSNEDILRLKAFGLRDAKLSESLEELADILERLVFPKVKMIFEVALRDFGFEP